ncbi:hypothetical protein phiCTP1_gp86 [Clostridium phage phiCTP1]|uniref:hypothetical protein n=1 Tax=Clostridium phage phiCTP1 TaxID=871584 RepID=UPI0001E07867|nr:hypothetical protein phiCTP1_gp86 [Clostridium phage phiCTP1]ADL40387.1 hypothetical phage protein [Clostridium phage phiCTP1]
MIYLGKGGVFVATKIYDKQGFSILRAGDGFIVYNNSKAFKEGHSHLRNYSACIRVIYCIRHKKIPKRTSFYFLQSLIRVASDDDYKVKVQALIDVRVQKGKKRGYYNNRF